MRRERAKTPANPQTQKSKENFWTCFAWVQVNRIRETSTLSYIVDGMSDVAQKLEEILKEEFAKFDPATLQYLEQLLSENEPAVRKIVQNVLDEPISQETEKRLQKPLLPKPYQPRPPPRQRKVRKTQ